MASAFVPNSVALSADRRASAFLTTQIRLFSSHRCAVSRHVTLSMSTKGDNNQHYQINEANAGENPTNNVIRVRLVANNKAIAPMRPPSTKQEKQGRESQRQYYEAEAPADEASRRANMMAPRSEGFGSLIPFIALLAGAVAGGYFGFRKFRKRQQELVLEFGETAVVYGNSRANLASIVREYKRKLGPGQNRGDMFKAFAQSLVTQKPVGVPAVEFLAYVKSLLKLSDSDAVKFVNQLGEQMAKQPSLLGKLIFLVERTIESRKLLECTLRSKSSMSPATIEELQKSMATRAYRDVVIAALDEAEREDTELKEFPSYEAQVLLIDDIGAKSIFNQEVVSRKQAALVKENAEEEAGKLKMDQDAMAELQELTRMAQSMDDSDEEPIKKTAGSSLHAFECSKCGYTLYPAAGREFKFYGDNFTCPGCGSGKDAFVDVGSS